jgi:hypothetical protein
MPPYERKGQRREPAANDVRFISPTKRLAPVRWTDFGTLPQFEIKRVIIRANLLDLENLLF